MGRINRADIEKAADLPTEAVLVPEWGGEVLVRGLNGTDKDQFLAETMKKGGDGKALDYKDITARLVARCLVDEAGERLYSDDEIGALGRKSGAVLGRLFKVAQRLSGLEEQAAEAAEKN